MDKELERNKELIEKRYDNYAGHNSVVPESARELAKLRPKFNDIARKFVLADDYSKKKTTKAKIILVFFDTVIWTLIILFRSAYVSLMQSSNLGLLVVAVLVAIIITAINAALMRSVDKIKVDCYTPYVKSMITTPNCSSSLEAGELLALAECVISLNSQAWKTFKLKSFSVNVEALETDVIIEDHSGCSVYIPLQYYDDTLPGFDFSKADDAFKDAIKFINALELPDVPDKYIQKMERKGGLSR